MAKTYLSATDRLKARKMEIKFNVSHDLPMRNR